MLMYRGKMRQRPKSFKLNFQHPLAQGLVFASLGNVAGGLKCFDSSLYGNHGTLTNMDPATDWVWDSTLNRFVLDFDGTDDGVTNTANVTGTTWCVSLWMNYTTTTQGYLLDYLSGRLVLAPTNTKIELYDGVWNSFGNAVLLNTWRHILFESDNGLHSCYLDGHQLGSSIAGTAKSLVGLSKIGCKYNHTVPFFKGQIGDIFVGTGIKASFARALADPSNVDLDGLIYAERKWWPVLGGGFLPNGINDYILSRTIGQAQIADATGTGILSLGKVIGQTQTDIITSIGDLSLSKLLGLDFATGTFEILSFGKSLGQSSSDIITSLGSLILGRSLDESNSPSALSSSSLLLNRNLDITLSSSKMELADLLLSKGLGDLFYSQSNVLSDITFGRGLTSLYTGSVDSLANLSLSKSLSQIYVGDTVLFVIIVPTYPVSTRVMNKLLGVMRRPTIRRLGKNGPTIFYETLSFDEVLNIIHSGVDVLPVSNAYFILHVTDSIQKSLQVIDTKSFLLHM